MSANGSGKRIVITSFGSYGDVNPYVGLALGLQARGHRPVLATISFYKEYIEREGIEFFPVRPRIDTADFGLVKRVMDPVRGTEFLVRELLMGSLRDAYADLREAARGADLLVTHPVTFAGPIVAEELGLPWVSTVLAPMSFFSVHDFPVLPPMPWTKKWEGVPGVARFLVGLSKKMTHGWMEPVRALRRERGLAEGAHPLFEGQHSPACVLGMFSRVLAKPQVDWPSNVAVTGPIFYNGPDREETVALEEFLAAGPAPVVFTLGTSAVASAGSFYEESAAAAARIGVRAVLLVGRNPENAPRGALPAGVIAVEYAAHERLFPRAAAIVHQAGIGTLAQALRSGRPQLIVPFAHDQPDNAYRAVGLGVARSLRVGEYRAGRVAAELRGLLEGGYAERAGAVGEVVRGEDGVGAACLAVEGRF